MGSPNGRPNAMASVASDEAFLLMECIKKCAVQGRALKKNCKRVYIYINLWSSELSDCTLRIILIYIYI